MNQNSVVSPANTQVGDGPALLAYTDPLSVAPGDDIDLMVSATHSYTVSLLRLIHGATDSRGPGVREEVVDPDIAVREPRVLPVPSGSYLRVPSHPCLDGTAVTITAWIFPTLEARGRPRAVLSRRDPGSGRGWAIGLTGENHLALWVGAGDEPLVVTDRPVPVNRWTFVAASLDAGGGAVVVQVPVPEWPVGSWRAAANVDGPIGVAATGVDPLIGAWWTADDDSAVADAHFNGRIDRPAIFDGAATEAALARAEPDSLGLRALARWHPGRETHRSTVPDGGAYGLHAEVVNTPARGVPGCNWTGREIDFRLATDEFDAIHFHDDDLTDAAWEPTVTFRVPDDLRSGAYAFRLDTGTEQLKIPFFVRPPRHRTTAPVAVLIPSFTYLAYSNRHRTTRGHDFDFTPQLAWATRHKVGGLYDTHRDGSGCYYASRRHPLVTMEPDLGGCGWELWNLSADLCLIDWLEAEGIAYDVICDEDVHYDGVDLLAGYSVVLTGTHPEYTTQPLLDAHEAYLAGGGRLMYLGGNGYYWVTGISADEPHVIEIRRGHTGTRCWEVPPGETHLSTTGEPGGLWRHRGRSPQRLVGVGFTADILNEPRFDVATTPNDVRAAAASTGQGPGRGRPYRPEPLSADDRGEFALKGVDGPIDAEGLVAGAPAGIEIDRLDPLLGSPPHTVVLASARDFGDAYQHVVEEVRSSNSLQSGSVEPRVRADLVFFETPRGGAVFSTGSMAWITCLGVDSHDNPVSRVTRNVLQRFLDPAPFSPVASQEQ